MSEQGDKLLKQVDKLLDEHGVSNWVFAFSDPDDAMDIMGVSGSKFWRAGVGMDLVADVRERRRIDRQGHDENEP